MEATMSSPVTVSAEFAGSACSELVDPLLRSAVDADDLVAEPILVATDGGRAAGAALRVAAALAARDDRTVDAIVVEGALPSVPGVCIGPEALRLESVPQSTRLGRVRQQLCTILGEDSLILMGLNRDGLARRLLGSGAVARVLQSAQIPVLAVPATARALPHAAVAAIDFSPASLHAAREARDLLDRPGTLHIVNVGPTGAETVEEIAGWDAIYQAGVAMKLEELAGELTTEGIRVVPRIESGPLVDTLFRVANEVSAEVIACGARNSNAIERHLLGHVPLQLMLGGECSVLIVPNASAAERAEETP
jgi:nucleotide-binding universal stress UspA family protein